ncbi:serine/threonine-protein phosphatase, partial [Streptomyces sp. SID8455]|nr:serine/threonine-protein phosphatase [Streptomyces sp. SID8455]
GHLPPRLLHQGRSSAVPLDRTSVPLGLAGLSRESRAEESFALPPEATLLVVTDGVTEARDAARDFYPFDQRLGDWAGHGPRELLDALHVDLEKFTGGIRRDDVAAL